MYAYVLMEGILNSETLVQFTIMVRVPVAVIQKIMGDNNFYLFSNERFFAQLDLVALIIH